MQKSVAKLIKIFATLFLYKRRKKMFQKFYPSEDWASVYEIPFEQYYKQGYRGLLFDVDNTLVTHGSPADQRAKELFGRLKRIGYEVCLISNNKEPRVASFSKDAGIDYYIFKANKPSAKGYLQGMEKMGTNKKNTIFIGDQIFTDVYGANKVGIKSILVKPIHPKEEIQIVLKRYLERIVLREYKRKKNR